MSYGEEQHRTQELVATVQEALVANDLLSVRDVLEHLHPSEIADLLESLPAHDRDELWVHIDSSVEGDVLAHSIGGVRVSIIEHMAPGQVAAATESLEADDAADILQDLPEDVAEAVLEAMGEQYRLRVSQVLDFDEDSAGGLMDLDAITVRADVNVDVVMRFLRRMSAIPERTDVLFVVNRENTYLGALALSRLLTSEPGQSVGDLMNMDLDGIPANTTADDVALIFEQRDLLSAPVVDDDGKVLGRITIDDVVDVIREQSARSFMSAAGLDQEEDIFAPVLLTARRRALWLGVNLATAFVAAWVIGLFDATIEQLVALAVLMPVVASMGGVAGSQTLTIVIRGLALGQVGSANARVLLFQELAVGALNGLLWALVVSAVTWMWFGDLKLGAVIAVAIVANLTVAAFAGAVIPFILRRLDVDPALAGGVVLTTVTDVVGFFAFLGLATIFLI